MSKIRSRNERDGSGSSESDIMIPEEKTSFLDQRVRPSATEKQYDRHIRLQALTQVKDNDNNATILRDLCRLPKTAVQKAVAVSGDSPNGVSRRKT